jgi:hypothetical protein
MSVIVPALLGCGSHPRDCCCCRPDRHYHLCDRCRRRACTQSARRSLLTWNRADSSVIANDRSVLPHCRIVPRALVIVIHHRPYRMRNSRLQKWQTNSNSETLPSEMLTVSIIEAISMIRSMLLCRIAGTRNANANGSLPSQKSEG